MARIVIGMSGGVDSSTAAYLLKAQGHDVIGVSFVLCDPSVGSLLSTGACSLPDSVNEAQRTARQIGIDHIVLDLRNSFRDRVVDPFVGGYRCGNTPNPCVLCNSHVKFPFLGQVADERGADILSTGHYARVLGGRLLKGLDPRKDQSYVLYGLTPDILKRLTLPLGTLTKAEVRAKAESLGLRAATRQESQEICFVGDRRCSAFLEGTVGRKEGPIVDVRTGKAIGRHGGVHLYTLGQRKRLVPTGTPCYVVRLEAHESTVYVGPKEMAYARNLRVENVNWTGTRDVFPQSSAEAPVRVTAKVRSTMRDEPAMLTVLTGGSVDLCFDEPQWAPAPGQSAVFYRDDTLLGGGVIASVGGSESSS